MVLGHTRVPHSGVDGGADAQEEDGGEDVRDRLDPLLDAVKLLGLGQDEPGRERTNDERRAGTIGQDTQQQQERERRHDQRAANPQPIDQPEEPRGELQSDPQGYEKERDRHAEDAQRALQGEGRPGREARDHAQDYEPDDVVDHRRTKNHACLQAVQHLEVLEHPPGDPDRGRGEGRAHKDGGRQRVDGRVLVPVPAGPPVQKAQDERHRDTHHRDRGRGGPHPHHRFEIGLEPDLEQQHDDADLGEQPKHRRERVVGADRDDVEKADPEEDPHHELAHHGGLPQTLERLAGKLGGEQHDGEHREKAGDVDSPRGCPKREGQAYGQGPRGQAKAAASLWDGS